MIQAMRASRAVPGGAWFGVADPAVPAADPLPPGFARRVVWEAGSSGLDSLARPCLAPAATEPPRPPSLLASGLAHAVLLAAVLLLAAPPTPPADQDRDAIPLVFEAPPVGTTSAAPAPLASVPETDSPPEQRLPAPPAPPSPASLPPDAAATPLLPVPPAASPPAAPAVASPAEPEAPALSLAPPPEAAASDALAAPRAPLPPHLRTLPPVRPVPHLPPSPAARAHPARPDEAPSARTEPTAGPAAPSAAPPAAPSQAAQPPGPTIAARPLSGAPGNGQPAYPEQARRRHVEGRVVVRAMVSADGRTASASLAQSSGSDILDQAALQAARGYRFSPALRGGAAVPGIADLPFTFRLEE